ncbi:MAG: response regulator [Thermodesulfobacteriota bacterium]|nr:response regulator [Thermodesulfobacteriota bacterium]
MIKEDWIGTIEAAKFCSVSRPAFRKWIDQGLIDAYITPGGTARVPVRGLIKTMKNHRMPIPDELTRLCYTRILIVDDEEEHRNIIIQALADNESYKTETAENGYEACILMGDFRPDLIIIDLMMPLMNGVGLLKEIRANSITKNAKIIVITGHPESSEAEEIIKIGVDAFFPKPIKLFELKQKIEELAVI